MIELKNITKTFSEGNISVHAVRDVSLVIDFPEQGNPHLSGV